MYKKVYLIKYQRTITQFISFALAAFILLGFIAWAEATTFSNPDWQIDLTDYGYSDYLGDLRPGFEGREYLSGEWAGAVSYNGIEDRQGISGASMWLEPNFIYPNWTTNSTFAVNTSMNTIGVNTDGFDIWQSSISNTDLAIVITSQFIDTVTGIEQGNHPASQPDPGSSLTSNQYILQQEYEITNISNTNIENLQFFQFLHGLNSESAVFDNRDYGGPYANYKYDITLQGIDYYYGYEVIHEDTLAFHANLEPTAWEVGYYGIEGIDNHGTGKPGTGVHLSVENNNLSGLDFFDPDTLWVSGALRFDLDDVLEVDESANIDVLLSIHTNTVPIPSSIVLLCSGVLALLGMGVKKKTS